MFLTADMLQGSEALDGLMAEESEMRVLNLTHHGCDDKWAVEFARRALPNMPKLESL